MQEQTLPKTRSCRYYELSKQVSRTNKVDLSNYTVIDTLYQFKHRRFRTLTLTKKEL